MNYYFYLIFIPILIIILYVFIKLIYIKYFAKNFKSEHGVEDVQDLEEDIENQVISKFNDVKTFVKNTEEKIETNAKNGFEEVREIFWKYFDIVFLFIKRSTVKAWHFFLHFLVLLFGFLSDLFDKLYAKTRNTFLYTATKDKSSVTTFWSHLKEYKKEVEEDWKKK